jgi:LysM repeat protein
LQVRRLKIFKCLINSETGGKILQEREEKYMANFKQGAKVAFTLLLGAMIASACNQPYSQPPTSTPIGNPTSLFPSPLTPQMSMSDIANLGTGTALAQTGTPQAIATQTISVGTQDLSASATPSALGTTNPTSASTSTLAVVGTPATAGPRPAEWELRKGEFPYCIARRFDVDPQALLSLNGLTNGNIFYPGRTLKIPQTGNFPGTRALRNHPATYPVASASETVYSIACLYGDVRPEAIAQANNLASADVTLTSGQQLSIP